MSDVPASDAAPLLLLVPGIKGAIGSTLCLASRMLPHQPEAIIPYLTATEFLTLPKLPAVEIAGWDLGTAGIAETVMAHKVVPPRVADPVLSTLDGITAVSAPDASER